MAFTYAKDNSDLSRLRVKVGDVDSSRPLFDDDEMNEFLAQDTNISLAAALACDALSTQFARDYDFSADGASFKKGSVSSMYASRARQLRRAGRGTVAVPTRRKDGYSDDVKSDESSTAASSSFDRSGLVN